jgi:hypothetical protein
MKGGKVTYHLRSELLKEQVCIHSENLIYLSKGQEWQCDMYALA